MGELVEVRQKAHHCQCLMAPPIGLCTYPNEYVITSNGGKEEGRIIEENNYCCQKCCFPCQRAYDSRIFVKQGGNTYTVKRPFAMSAFMMFPCYMPKVNVFD